MPDSKIETILCPCCENFIDKTPIELSCSIQELSFLGPTFTLYFELQKLSIKAVFILFFVYCLSTIIVSVFIKGSCDKNI